MNKQASTKANKKTAVILAAMALTVGLSSFAQAASVDCEDNMTNGSCAQEQIDMKKGWLDIWR